jgi:hypothetical protein
MQNIHSATKDFEAAQRVEREAFIQVQYTINASKNFTCVYYLTP